MLLRRPGRWNVAEQADELSVPAAQLPAGKGGTPEHRPLPTYSAHPGEPAGQGTGGAGQPSRRGRGPTSESAHPGGRADQPPLTGCRRGTDRDGKHACYYWPVFFWRLFWPTVLKGESHQ